MAAHNMEFNIPLSREELASSVTLSSPSELTNKIDDCQTRFATIGIKAIGETFDIFYSVVHHFTLLSKVVREHYWAIIIEALVDSCQLSECVDDKSEQRSLIKMLIYVTCQFIEEFESLLKDTQTQSLQVTKKRKGKKGLADSSGCGQMWEGEREKVIVTLTQFLDQDLIQYWDPPTPEMLDDLTGLVTSSCCKMLECAEVSRDKDMRRSLSSLLGAIVKKYHQNKSVSVKLIQALQTSDHLSTNLSQIIELIVTEYDIHSFVANIIEEISSIEQDDLNMDTSGTKNYASFIIELSEHLPHDVLPCVESLVPHLTGESYTMRNSVLSVFGEIISKVLTGPDLSPEQRTLRDDLFDKLSAHVHDVNAFVRSKVLQVWQTLSQSGAIPLYKQKDILTLVTGRLRDKSSLVRKSAIQLIANFITSNPFSPKLDLKSFKDNLLKEEETLRALLPSTNNGQEEGEEERERGGEERGGEEESEEIEERRQEETEENAAQVAKQMAVVQYHRDAVTFIERISSCLPLVTQLLGSKVTSDVMESIELLSVAHSFNINGSQSAIRKTLVLMWSSEQAIRELVMNVYARLFLTPPTSLSPIQRNVCIVKNLLTLINGVSIGELASVEEMIVMCIRKGLLPDSVLGILWDVFCGRVPNSSPILALILITMAARERPDIVLANVQLLLHHGLPVSNLLLSKWTCIALQRCNHTHRFPVTHEIFSLLSDLLINSYNLNTSYNWIPLAEQAIVTIYSLAEHPDKIMENIIKRICRALIGNNTSETPPTTNENSLQVSSNEEPGQVQALPTEGCGLINPLTLTRFIFLLGQVAKQQLVHVEVNINKEMRKRRNDETTPTEKESCEEEGGGEEEIGLGGATDEDLETEIFKRVCNEELCNINSLLGALLPLVVTIVTNSALHSYTELQTTAVLTLSKYMLLNSRTCDKYLRLLFTLLENSTSHDIRSNTIIALGDLTVRFPNLIQPWTSHLYSRLRDSSHSVRQNTIVVLTHLVLNDMVKVKGQISEMALCLEDPLNDISDRAKLFFLELSRKGNSLYNVLPDIISHLSDPSTDNNVTPESFRTIMKYLLSFVQKDKQSEGLADKLCHRFRATRTEQQARDLAFCLSQINFSDRGLRKLQENLPCYHGYLSDVEIYNCFMSIISKGKKLTKPDMKVQLDEYEAKLTEIHHKGIEQDTVTKTPVQQAVEGSPVRVTTARRRPHPPSTRRQQVLTPLSDNHNNVNAVTSARRQRRRGEEKVNTIQKTRQERTRRRATPVPLLSESDDDNN